jgi:hypothetical protein
MMLFFARTILMAVVAVCSLTAHSIAGPIVLFDESHAQQFVINKSGPLDLSDLAVLYQDNGFNVISHADGLTKAILASVDVLVISGPFLPFSESELETVIDFIDAGGGLAIMLHIAPPARDLLHHLDVDYTNGTLRETSQTVDGNPLNFRVSIMADHPVTAGLDNFTLYGAWALRGTAPHTTIIAATSQHSWIDLNRDNQLTEVDAMQTFGVMIAGEIGQGRYVVLGDDAVFQNRFLDEANRQLALKLVYWLGHK